jgi:hypothetical protein
MVDPPEFREALTIAFAEAPNVLERHGAVPMALADDAFEAYARAVERVAGPLGFYEQQEVAGATELALKMAPGLDCGLVIDSVASSRCE